MTKKEREALLRMQRKQNITGTAGVQTSDTQQAVADAARANNVPYYQQFANEASDWQAQEAERKKNEPPDYDALHAQIMQGVEQRKKQWEYEHSKEYKLANSKYADAYRQIGLLKDKPYEPKKTAKDSFFSFDPQEFKTKVEEKAAANQQYQDRLRQDANNLWLQNLTAPAEIAERPEGTPAELPPVPESPSVLDYVNYFLQRGSVGVDNMMEGIETGVNRFGAALGGFLGDEVLAPGSSVQGRSTGFSRPAEGMPEQPKNTLDAIKQNVANTVERMNQADLRVLEESTKNSQVDKKRDEINQKYANVASTGVGQVLGDLSETVSPMLLEAAFWNTAWADVPALKNIWSSVERATSRMPAMQAKAIRDTVRGIPLALTRGALAENDAYAVARRKGSSPVNALMFSKLEGVNQGVGELLLNGVGGMGSGLAQAVPAFGKVGKFLARAYGTAVKSPAMKTALRYSGNIVGEALEEIIQSGVTTLNARMTYDPGAKFDLREASYEGLLAGITAAALGLPDAFTDAFGTSKGPDGTPIYEGYYYMYRADYEAINNFSKAAASVASEADAADIRAYGEELIKGFDAVLADNSINFETRAETEYLKHGIQTVLNQMDADLDSIIYYNEAFDDAVDAVGDADADDYVDDVANLVTVVGENADPDADIVRETVDRVNNEIRDNIDTEQEVASMTDEEFVEWMRTARLTGELEGIANAMRGQQTNLLLPGNPSVDPTNSRNVEAARQRVIQELRIRRELLQRINGALRNQKSEITAIVSGMLDQEIAAQNSGLQNAAGRGIISQESTVLPNPVMQADGKSLIPQAESAAPVPEPGKTKYDLVHTEYTHTKTGAKMNLYRFNGNLSDDDYKALKKAVGSVGGYWNKFAKGFVVPDDGVPKLADALGKINVGIDESQYRPTAGTDAGTTAPTGEAVRTPNESTVPKIEVVGDDGSVRTDTAERPKAPEFEVYEGGGDLVPAGAQTAMQGTDASVPGVQGNAGPSFDTDAGTGAGTQGGNATPQVQGAAGSGKTRTPVNAQGTEKDEDDEWDDAVRALGEKWGGISAREFIQALDTVYETLAETTPKTEDGKYDMRSLDAETVQRAATDLSRDLIREASVKEDNPEYETAREALRYLRTTPMYYDRDKMIAELGGKYEYNRWKKSMFGKLRLVTDRSRGVKAVDEIFPEFAEQFPGIVDLTAWNELDQLRELSGAVEELRRNGKQVDVNPYDIDRNGAETELAVDLVTEAMNRLIGYKPERPWNAKKPTEPEVKAESTIDPRIEKYAKQARIDPVGLARLVSDYDKDPDSISDERITGLLKDVPAEQHRAAIDGIRGFLADMSGSAAKKPMKTEAKLAEKPKTSEPEGKPAEKTSSSAYDELAEKLRTHDLVETNGLKFRVYFHSGPRTYSGRIEEIPEVLPNGVPIYNARGVKYDTGDKATRDEAVSELLTVARNSRLFNAKDDGRKSEKPKTEEPEANPAERPSEKPAEEPESAPAASGPYVKIADWVSDRLKRGLDIDKKDLQVVANDAYGGTMAEGAYDVKDMTDALELGVNRFIIDHISNEPSDYNSKNPVKTSRALEYLSARVLDHIPTQTNRTDEQIKLQQFSTPPNIAFLANWVANIDGTDTVLEPSAGIGGLASFAKGMGAKVVVNELSDRRLELLKTLPFDGFYHENAEQIDNILPDDVKPTVVVMNPPFSANGRTKNKTANAIPHIEQALERLEDGGRLVAILGGGRDAGGGMSDSAPAFKQWWNDLRDDYSIRANIGIDGKNYKKYGTSFNVRLVVIDKTGKQEEPTLTGEYEDLNEAIKDLEEIRNDRQHHVVQTDAGIERNGTVQSGRGSAAGNGGGSGRGYGSGKRPDSRIGSSDSNESGSVSSVQSETGELSGERAGSDGELGDVHAENQVRNADEVRGGDRGGERGKPQGNSETGKSGQSSDVESGSTRGVASDESGELVQSGSDLNGGYSVGDIVEAGGEYYQVVSVENGEPQFEPYTSSAPGEAAYNVGDVVEYNGKYYQVAELSADGSVVLEEYRQPKKASPSGVSYALQKPERITLSLNSLNNAVKNNQIRIINSANAAVRTSGFASAPKAKLSLKDLEKKAGANAPIKKITDPTVLKNIRTAKASAPEKPADIKPESANDLKAGTDSIPTSTTEDNNTVVADSTAIYAEYRPAAKPFKNAVKHPAKLVESAAMAAVKSPKLKRIPNIPEKLISSGALSDAQLETTAYAGQAHQERLPDGRRKGYFIGDGTGVGKGREICGIILDDFHSPGSKKKEVWVSEKWKLMNDAKRDWSDMGHSPDEVIDFSKARDSKKGFPKEGIMFITYDTLKAVPRTKGKKSNLELLEEWLGKDFDGCIIFDEAHNMGGLLKKNSKGEDGTAKARAGDKLQNDLPNAKVTYLSATGATEIDNFAYISRLGLWGPRTAFESASDFTYQIGASGISALELVSRDMKAQGLYLARSISYEDVQYDTLKHDLSKGQRAMYDRWCDAWQTVLANVDKAIKLTGSESSQVVRRRKSQIFSNLQNFYNQTITSMMTPSVLDDIERELAAGHSCVIQLTNTNESILDKELMKRNQSSLDDDDDYDDLDLTPRDLLIGYIENAFPVEQYEEYIDENGKKRSRPVVDSAGNPVINKKALAMKEELLADLRDIAVPEGPLDMIINRFGVDAVAEVTGRSKRVVNVTDSNGNTKKVKLQRDPAKDNEAETKAFQDGKKRILIFSTAGSTGSSYHADRRAKNQQQRIHYILQPGWRADIATQGFGRTHRSNEVIAPIYRLVTTNIPGQKRFVTSIAKRLNSMGALTKGDSKAGSGVFDDRDNLETNESKNALEQLYQQLLYGYVNGLDGQEILTKMGLMEKFTDKNSGGVKIDPEEIRNMTRFLNRMLVLRIDEQEKLFQKYSDLQEIAIQKAIESGTLDRGVEGISADKVVINSQQTVYTDPKTGAETQYVKATLSNKPRLAKTVADAKKAHVNFEGLYRRKTDGSVVAAYRTTDMTDDKTGEVVHRYRLIGPNQSVESIYKADTLKSLCEKIPEKEWNDAWAQELAQVPEYIESDMHMITGTLLPIWGKLAQSSGGWKIHAKRLTSSDGKQSYLGVVIGADKLNSILRQLNITEEKIQKTGKQLREIIMKQNKSVTFNSPYSGVLTVAKRRVANENRMEITGPNMMRLSGDIDGIITETVAYNRRYFIPDNELGEKILDRLAKEGIRSIDAKENTGNMYSAGLSAGKWGKGDRDKEAEVKSVSDLVKEAQRIFGIPINTGRMNRPKGVQGMFKEQPETIRTRKYGDIPTIAHEVGHYFDKKYHLRESPYIDTLVDAFKKDLSRAGYSPLLYASESVAEYFSAYMIDRPKTEKRFKKFTEWLNQTLSETDLKKLNDFTDMSNGYFAADQERRAEAQVHYRTEDSTLMHRAQEQLDDAKRNPREFFGDLSRTFVRNWFDDLVDLRGFGNTYDLAYYEKQAKSVAYGRLVYGMTDGEGNIVGKSLAEVLSDGNITDENIRDFDAYLIACIALDRLEAAKSAAEVGKEIPTLVYADEELGTEASLVERIDKYERENPTFHKTAQGVYTYENQLMDVAVASGLVSEDLVEHLRSLYPHYVPLYRVMDDAKQKTRGAKRGYEGQSSPVGRFKGSGRDIYSPIENIIMNTEKYTVSAMRNDVMTEFCDFIDNNEGMGWAAEKIPPAMVLDYISTDEIGKKIDEFVFAGDRLDRLSEKEKAEFYTHLMSFLGDYATQWKPSGKKGHNVVSVMRDGKVQYYEVHDPGVYAALTNLDAPQWDMVTKFFGAVTRFEKMMFTSTNPQFIFTNPQRDVVTGFVSSTTTDNPFTYVADMIKAFGDAIRGNETYERYMQAGGGYMGSLTSDYNVLRRVSKDVVKGNKSQIKKFGDMIAEFVPRLVDAGETASRLAEWKRAIAQGADNTEAMRKAQEITVNFARGGKIVKRINQYIPFFQAGFSALAHDYDLFVNGGDGGGGRNGGNGFGMDLSAEGKRRRAKAWMKWFLTTALLALLAWLFNWLISPKLTGESEEEVMQHWDDLSNYNKNAYYNLYVGNGRFIRWKKTQDMAIGASIVERMFEYTVLDQKDSLNGMGDYVFDNVLSISLNPMDVLSDVSLIGPIVSLARKQDFKGTPIVPKKLENADAPEQYNDNTSTIAIALGQIFNASPIELQYLGESYFGWAARLVNNLTPYNGERSLGIGNKLVADSAYSTDIINNFYNQKEAYDKRADGYKRNPTSERYALEDVYGAYKYDKVSKLYSKLNTMTRDEPDNDISRDMKIQTNALIQTVNEDGINELDRAVIDLAERTGLTDLTSIAPYIIVPDKLSVGSGANKVELPLEYDDMVLYYNQSQAAFEEVYSRIMQSGYSDEMIAQAMAQAKTAINNGLSEAWKQRLVARKMGE